MSRYKTKEIGGITYVLCDSFNRKDVYPNANFQGTGLALCGILKNSESLEDWLLNHKNIKKSKIK